MSTTAATTGASILSQYAIGAGTATSSTANSSSGTSSASNATQQALGQNDFLNMMITQLKSQDPLNPMDNSAFVAQLAQFSQVQGIQNMNTSMQSLSSNLTSNQALQASSLIGKKVYVNTSSAIYDGSGSFQGLVSVPQSASNLSLTISDSHGTVLRHIDLGSQAAGETNFQWNGLDDQGQALPAGTYKISAQASIGGSNTQLTTALPANVNTVSFSAGGPVELNLQGLGSFALTDVQQIGQ